jgi:ABC-type bacteriocin/lantibiotic exporter with double-glycine peptidase domain
VIRSLELDRVSFSYVPGEWVLQDVSFNVRQGQTVALVGPTGAGKTSVLNLIQRFYDPISGQVRINGEDVRQWDMHRLRSMTALVTQEPVLFSTTVRENIFSDPAGWTGMPWNALLPRPNAKTWSSVCPRASIPPFIKVAPPCPAVSVS